MRSAVLADHELSAWLRIGSFNQCRVESFRSISLAVGFCAICPYRSCADSMYCAHIDELCMGSSISLPHVWDACWDLSTWYEVDGFLIQERTRVCHRSFRWSVDDGCGCSAVHYGFRGFRIDQWHCAVALGVADRVRAFAMWSHHRDCRRMHRASSSYRS